MAEWINLAVESASILPCISVMEQASASSYLSLTPRTVAPVPPRQLGWYFLCSFSAAAMAQFFSVCIWTREVSKWRVLTASLLPSCTWGTSWSWPSGRTSWRWGSCPGRTGGWRLPSQHSRTRTGSFSGSTRSQTGAQRPAGLSWPKHRTWGTPSGWCTGRRWPPCPSWSRWGCWPWRSRGPSVPGHQCTPCRRTSSYGRSTGCWRRGRKGCTWWAWCRPSGGAGRVGRTSWRASGGGPRLTSAGRPQEFGDTAGSGSAPSSWSAPRWPLPSRRSPSSTCRDTPSSPSWRGWRALPATTGSSGGTCSLCDRWQDYDKNF